MKSIETLRAEALAHVEAAQNIQKVAADESRDITPDEQASITAHLDANDSLVSQLATAERLAAAAQNMAAPQRKTSPAAAPLKGTPGISATENSKTWDFKGLGDYFGAVNKASQGVYDPRLVKNATTYANEGTNADGGFLLPPDFRAGVQKLLQGPTNIFSKLDQIQTQNATITLPVDEDPDWSSQMALGASLAENATITQVKPVFKQLQITPAKYGVVVPVTSEMLQDGTLIESYLPGKAASKVNWKLNALTYTALMASGSKLATAEGAATVGQPPQLANLQNMWAALHTTYREDAVWLMNPLMETALQGFVVGNFPVYMPAGGISQSPYATLFGRPVIFSEVCAAVGTEGDAILFSPRSVYAVTKPEGIRVDVDRSIGFNEDMVYYRFIVRAAIKSKLSATVARPDATTCSNIVTTATRV